jgi:hypothetical protein
MHSSLVVTTEGLPLGIAALKFWTRKRFKGSNALEKKINSTRVPIEKKESVRWLAHILSHPSRRPASDAYCSPAIADGVFDTWISVGLQS